MPVRVAICNLLIARGLVLQVGDVVVGTVQAVKPYGAFVDVGGLNGLLHISQISHDRIVNVENVLSEGDKLKVRPAPHPVVNTESAALRHVSHC